MLCYFLTGTLSSFRYSNSVGSDIFEDIIQESAFSQLSSNDSYVVNENTNARDEVINNEDEVIKNAVKDFFKDNSLTDNFSFKKFVPIIYKQVYYLYMYLLVTF